MNKKRLRKAMIVAWILLKKLYAVIRKKEIVYISGPITGHPDAVYWFNAGIEKCRKEKKLYVNPYSFASLTGGDWAWEAWMKFDVLFLVMCDSILIVGPSKGIWESQGVRTENFLAATFGMKKEYYFDKYKY